MTTQEEPTLYDILGGEPGLRRLVERFYHHMDTRPEVRLIREMHQKDLASAKEKLFMFLSGWTGGPPLFAQRYGHPRLRARHLPFAINKQARDQWLQCMLYALEDIELEETPRYFLMDAFLKLADHMRNQPEPEPKPESKPGTEPES